ncbi:Endonuclease/exonuclease/phosphatase, partial [Cercophora newfieldiana]
SIRIFSWNINGMDAFLPPPHTQKITTFFHPKPSTSSHTSPPPSPSPLRAFLTRHNNPHVLFLQELKIAPQNAPATLASLRRALQPPSTSTSTPPYKIHTSLPRDKHNARAFGGKLYGVAALIRCDFADRHLDRIYAPDWDREGRVLILELKPPSSLPAKPNTQTPSAKPLTLINTYAPNGTSAPYYHPQTGTPTGTRHDFKLRFHSLLRDECLALQARGFHVVIAGDVNVARGPWDGFPRLRTVPGVHCENRKDFNGKFFGREDCERAGADWNGEGDEGCLDAVDVWRGVYGAERRYTYYPRGVEWGRSCDRVDMVFVSRELWEEKRVLGTGILDTVQERGTSDHVPVWVEVRLG